LQALLEGVAPAELAQHDFVGAPAHVFGAHDFIGVARFEHAVLVDARGVRKGIGTHHRLVGLHHKTGGLAHHAAGCHDVFGVDAQVEVEVIAAGFDRHHNFFQRAVARFKELADRKSEIFDEDILALVSDESVTNEKEQYGFVSLSQRSETGEQPHAAIVFTVAGKEVKSASQGNGPVDASLKAIESHVKSGAEMVLYSVNAISGSTESQGEVTVRLQNSGRVVNGVGSDPDIVVASAKAYLSALNKLQSKADRVAAQG